MDAWLPGNIEIGKRETLLACLGIIETMRKIASRHADGLVAEPGAEIVFHKYSAYEENIRKMLREL